MTKVADDVALRDANILWTPEERDWPRSDLRGSVHVESRHTSAPQSLYLLHAKSMGACTMWGSWTDEQRLLELTRLALIMTAIDGVDAAEVHRAFASIPEYRPFMARSVPEWKEELKVEEDEAR